MKIFDEELLIVLVVLVAILFLFLVIMALVSLFFPENKRHSSYIDRNNKQIGTPNHKYEDMKPYKPQKSMGGNGRLSSNQPFHSDLFVNNNCDFSNDKSGNITTSNNDFITDQMVNHSQIQQSLNCDGTMRTEVDFDLSFEDHAPELFLKKYDYLETANNGRFRRLLPTDEKSFFRTWVENGTRLFEFHGNVDKALANINAIFDDVCEIEGKQNGASNIINEKPGILDSDLSVERKAIIKLI